MPKLVVDLNHSFVAGPLMHSPGSFELDRKVPKNIAQELIETAKQDDFVIHVCFLDPEDGIGIFGFALRPKGRRSIFTHDFDLKKGIVSVTAQGEFVSAGSRDLLTVKKWGSKADLRLSSFMLRNPWDGFVAELPNQKRNDEKNWTQLRDWKIV